jgi:hypothetical protein
VKIAQALDLATMRPKPVMIPAKYTVFSWIVSVSGSRVVGRRKG